MLFVFDFGYKVTTFFINSKFFLTFFCTFFHCVRKYIYSGFPCSLSGGVCSSRVSVVS